jgi:hypothetical protein
MSENCANVTEARLPLEPTATTKTPLHAFAAGKATSNLPRLPAVTDLRPPLAVTRTRSFGLNPRPATVRGEIWTISTAARPVVLAGVALAAGKVSAERARMATSRKKAMVKNCTALRNRTSHSVG